MTSTSTASKHESAPPTEVLVRAGWLAEHLHDPGLQVIEVDVSAAAYDQGHIEGAVLWNVYQDLKGSDYRTVDTSAIERLIRRSGVDENSTVVFYGYAPAMGFWLMKLFGHPDVHILDCARQSWAQSGLPWTAALAIPAPTRYELPAGHDSLRADHSEVEAAIHRAECTILDVRTDLEFRGERFWPSGGFEPGGRAGHIPSARNVSIEGVYNADGSFRREAELSTLFAGVDISGEVITYCTIGARACTAWFVFTYLLGREHIRVYDGSWAEWGLMPTTPV